MTLKFTVDTPLVLWIQCCTPQWHLYGQLQSQSTSSCLCMPPCKIISKTIWCCHFCRDKNKSLSEWIQILNSDAASQKPSSITMIMMFLFCPRNHQGTQPRKRCGQSPWHIDASWIALATFRPSQERQQCHRIQMLTTNRWVALVVSYDRQEYMLGRVAKTFVGALV